MTHEELHAITVEKLPGSEVKITGELPYSYLHAYRAHAIEHVGAEIEIDGFRKGHIPENVLIARVGEMALLGDMAEHALEKTYRDIIQHHNLDVVGHPAISITKLAKDNPLGFSITVAVMPHVELPDFKKIATDINKNKESKEVTDREVDKQIEDILRQKVAYERLQSKAVKKTEVEKRKETLGDVTEIQTPETIAKEGDPIDDPAKLPIPELTDELAKTLGQPGQFTTVTDFKEKIKEHLTIQKDRDVTSRHRAKITDAIADKTTIELPKVMIDAELRQMSAQMEEDLNRAQLKIDDYLAHIKKTMEDLMKEWTPAAEKRAKLQLILNAIAKQDAVKPDLGAVDHEVSHLLEQYKDADESRVRIYVESVLTNEAVMKMLEAL